MRTVVKLQHRVRAVVAVLACAGAVAFSWALIHGLSPMPKSADAFGGTVIAPVQVLAKPAQRPEYARLYLRPARIPYPDDNPYSPEKERLGQLLFFDPRLSFSGDQSCASCHNPSFNWGDGLGRAIGFDNDRLPRRTPTILNLAWAELLFWDGRADSLETQALMPIASHTEMNMTLPALVSRIRAIAEYMPLFDAALPNEGITAQGIARAIATYERGIVSSASPFDRWLAGDDSALSRRAVHGFEIFNTTGECAKCHTGWAFTDSGFHDTGVRGVDVGRFANLPLPSMQHAFKTPTLRNVDRRAPYMHDGSEPTLAAVVESYNTGGREKRPGLQPLIHPLHLTRLEQDDLISFLTTLTSEDPPVQLPLLPR